MISSLFPLYSFRATQVGCRFWSNLVWTRTLISLTPACSSSWMSSARRSAGRSARSWKSKRAPRTCVERRQIREMLSRSDQVLLLSTKLWAQTSMNYICNVTTTHNWLKRHVFTAGSFSGRSWFLSCLVFILKPHLSLSHSSFLIMQDMCKIWLWQTYWGIHEYLLDGSNPGHDNAIERIPSCFNALFCNRNIVQFMFFNSKCEDLMCPR